MLTREEVLRILDRIWLPLALVILAFIGLHAFTSYDQRQVDARLQENQTFSMLEQKRIEASREARNDDNELARQRLDVAADYQSVVRETLERFRYLRDDMLGWCKFNNPNLTYKSCLNDQFKLLQLSQDLPE